MIAPLIAPMLSSWVMALSFAGAPAPEQVGTSESASETASESASASASPSASAGTGQSRAGDGPQGEATADGTAAAAPDPATSESEVAPEESVAEPEPAAVESAEPAQVGPQPAAPSGPPFATSEDEAALRVRYGIAPAPTTPPRQARWRCLIADPTCAFTAEVNAMGAYAYRVRQGDVSSSGNVNQWSSGRAQYDVWLNFASVTEAVGRTKYTRLTLGPKAGLTASDTHDLWGNFGIAARYWFGRGAWSPALEFTSALNFKLRGERGGNIDNQRSPIGLSGDVGLNIGGWGAIVVGGQYDTPLAREEVPESVRVSAGGMFFVGFRGNILWGAPAVAAVATHAAAQRSVQSP